MLGVQWQNNEEGRTDMLVALLLIFHSPGKVIHIIMKLAGGETPQRFAAAAAAALTAEVFNVVFFSSFFFSFIYFF